MDSDIVGSILLQVVLIAVNAVFACAEIAVVSCNDAKLEKMAQEGNKRAAKLFHLTEQPSRFLATIQVVITLSGFLGSAFAAENFSDRIVSALVDAGMKIPEKTLDAIAVVLITLLLSYITLIFGELVPKRIAMQKAEQIALGISGLVSGASKVFAPLVWLLTASTNGILRLLGIDPDEDDDQVTEEDGVSEKNAPIVHKTIKKVTDDIDTLKMNTAIAALMAMVNEFYSNGLSRGDFEALLLMLSPFAPHMVEELWEQKGFAAKYEGKMAMQCAWPEYDESKTVASSVEMAVQVSGKFKGTIIVPVDSDQDTVVEAAKASEKVAKAIAGMQIVKVIHVKNKLVNLIVKPC